MFLFFALFAVPTKSKKAEAELREKKDNDKCAAVSTSERKESRRQCDAVSSKYGQDEAAEKTTARGDVCGGGGGGGGARCLCKLRRVRLMKTGRKQEK